MRRRCPAGRSTRHTSNRTGQPFEEDGVRPQPSTESRRLGTHPVVVSVRFRVAGFSGQVRSKPTRRGPQGRQPAFLSRRREEAYGGVLSMSGGKIPLHPPFSKGDVNPCRGRNGVQGLGKRVQMREKGPHGTGAGTFVPPLKKGRTPGLSLRWKEEIHRRFLSLKKEATPRQSTPLEKGG